MEISVPAAQLRISIHYVMVLLQAVPFLVKVHKYEIPRLSSIGVYSFQRQ